MPISSSYKSMIKNMAKQYKGGKIKCKKLSDGSQACASEKAWSVFYATLKKKGLKDTKTSHKTSESMEDWLAKKLENEKKNKEIEESVERTEKEKKEKKFLEKWLKSKGLN